MLSLEVELLVRAHECHTLACNMEGIAAVLRNGRVLTIALAETRDYMLMIIKYSFFFFFLNIKRLVMSACFCLVFWCCLVHCIRCRLSNCPFDCFRVVTRQSFMRKRLITVAELYTWFMSMNRAKSIIQSSQSPTVSLF